MMGHDHARSGVPAACVAVLVARAFGEDLSVFMIALSIVLTCGAALLPDLDHPSATAAHTFGPITRGIAEVLNGFGEWLYYRTRSNADKPHIKDGHRTFSHTVVFALLAGVFVALACSLGGKWALLVTLFILASLALRGAAGHHGHGRRRHRLLPRLPRGPIGISFAAAALSAAAYFLMPTTVNGVFIGICVAVGCITHDLGDACTLYGDPLFWPLPIKGQRWYLVGTPRALRFRTGNGPEHVGERRFRVLLNIVTVILLVTLAPGSWTWLFEVGQRGWSTVVALV
jgi:membrane-bound metal-dependent hydrolase YbcI (DUF457 family)